MDAYLYFSISGLLNAIFSSLLGLFVFLKNPQNKINRAFAYFCASVAIWSYPYAFWPLAQTREATLFWFQLLHIGAAFTSITYLHFVLVWLNLEQSRKKILVLGYMLGIFFATQVFSPYFISDMVPKFSMRFWAVPGILYHFYLLYFFFYFLYSAFLLFVNFIKSADLRKAQIGLILVGTLMAFVGGSSNYLLWYDINFPPYLNILVTLFVLLTAYAIIVHKLMDIKVVLTESLVGIISVVLLVQVFFASDVISMISEGFFLMIFVIFGFYLVKATREERQRREYAEQIAAREHILRQKAEQVTYNLQELDKAKNQFMLSTQHHLRSPLSVIQGYLSMILEGSYGKISKKASEKILVSLGETKKLIKVVNDLLDMAKYQMNEGNAERGSTDICYVLRDLINDLKPVAAKKNIFLAYDDPGFLPPVSVNEKSVREALYNIIDNGIKYTNKGGVTVKSWCTDDHILISVADTGIGIEEVDTLGIFKRSFVRGERASAINTTGKGIGLYLAGQMILANGGNIWIISGRKYHGTTFYVELPVDQASTENFANFGNNGKTNSSIAINS